MCQVAVNTPRGRLAGAKSSKKSNFGVEGDLRHEHDGRPRESASKSRLEMHKSGLWRGSGRRDGFEALSTGVNDG